ncbi:type I methionyl aminopeptidase [Neomegalonema sp.]|uniref:type I methionyl aminopeptidase n=1 Tax=Neomegalonema sp. TaxID=2039713 RepID=UPI002602692E|nr:type I methionyl aminopeptidase [Neomegalonema sp.]MDD2868823.1 type I methionyl aminopeptidase [Neomegalonema sp.]
MQKAMKTEAARSPEGVRIYAPEDFEGMRRAGRTVAEVLDMIEDHVRPGITTAELDRLCEEFVRAGGATSATIGYRGYRHASCISINHVVCHGIPGERALKDGDILNIDVTVIVDGWYGDSSRMYVAGEPSVKAKRLIETTYNGLMRGIEAVSPGGHFGDIGAAIQTYAEARRCSVVREFCGHGLGRVFHDSPNVLHYGKPGTRERIHPGMFFTIEPMLNLGRPETKILSDGWTAVTRDMSLSAQYEHSVGVTDQGVEIFTLSPAGRFTPPWLR